MPNPPSAADTKLSISGIAKRYGPTAALEPTTLDVRRGEFLTLLGPSGSGKTTLLMMIAGLVEPSAGRILLEGEDITERPAYRRDIGLVFQNYALFPHLTVAENIAFPLEMRHMPRPEMTRAVTEALELVRLPHLGQRYPRELSGGQQQRVAFARAIVFKPALVLMDEPLGALDKKLREELKLELRKLHRELGATIVYVTHDQDEAMLLSDRICLMANARVAQVDAPTDLYNRPRSRFAAEFIGESNIAHGVLEQSDETWRVALDGGPRLACAAPTARPAGPVSVLIRPERIRLAKAGPGFPAEVETVLDLGGIRRFALRTPGGLGFDVVELGSATAGLAVGDQVRCEVAAADVVPLNEGAPS
ncbi:ABC transporter ATP-binding protein [Phreatobacter stygius]|uniref:ABC transporter ATP-binding protein n=2 Tax=Phreatobacter stygius TaxID=1940610 RepID=A0A4D7B626_9HYPH|nr:ABC transporter ATP-binding protein [Phreatobacter stygius]